MDYDIIVVGAGAMGSSTAYWCQKSGLKTLLLDQYEPFHTRGSSHGESRIIRLSYSEPYFIDMMKSAYNLWELLEKESKTKLLFKTGGIDFGNENDKGIKKVIHAHRQAKLNNEILDYKEMKHRFPQFNLEKDDLAIFQQESGIVNPHLTIHTLNSLFMRMGGVQKTSTPVQTIDQTSDGYVIKTPQNTYQATNVVLCPGSWVQPLLSKMGMVVEISILGITYAFWEIKELSLKHHEMPIFIHWDDEVHYGFPEFEKKGLIKVAAHISPTIPSINPTDDLESFFSEQLSSTSTFIEKKLVGISPIPIEPTNCKYTMTEDENFIIGKLPGYERLFIAAGFSGHGFKFTPLIGQFIRDLIVDRKPKYDLSHFDPAKFISEKK